MNTLIIIMICSWLFSLNATGQELDSIDSSPSADSASSFLGRLHQVQNYLDSAARRKVDPRYIEVPEKPWRVILRYKENIVDVDYTQGLDFPEYNEYMEWNLRFKPPRGSSIGFWAGYRGTGISYSKSLNKNAGRYFSVSSTGARYGFNFRLRRFNTDETVFTAKDYVNGKMEEEPIKEDGQIPSPVWIRSVYLNGYYVFNGRRYSQAAAYNQSVIQRRSAGSILAGVTWYQSSFDYSDMNNGFFMLIGHGTRRIKVHQANIGLGYGYNLVPFRGFVINAMAMPTLSVYNRVKVYKYDFNYDLFLDEEDDPEDYGNWNSETHTWDNGKTHRPIEMGEEDEGLWLEELEYWDIEPETAYSMLQLNLDLRLGIAYNWKNCFIGLQAQFNNFNYKKDNCKVNLFDAYARIAFGVRL